MNELQKLFITTQRNLLPGSSKDSILWKYRNIYHHAYYDFNNHLDKLRNRCGDKISTASYDQLQAIKSIMDRAKENFDLAIDHAIQISKDTPLLKRVLGDIINNLQPGSLYAPVPTGAFRYAR